MSAGQGELRIIRTPRRLIRPSDWYAASRIVEGCFRRLGLTVHEGSRIRGYGQTMESIVEQRKPCPTGRDLYLAMVNLPQIAFLSQEWSGRLNSSSAKHRLSQVQRDSPNVFLRGSSGGHDAQFEALCAAGCSRAGFACLTVDPERRQSGDFRVSVLGVTLVLEAKRVKTLEALSTLVRNAEQQILATGDHGVVMLDISPLLAARIGLDSRGPLLAAFDAESEAMRLSFEIESLARSALKSPRVVGLGIWSSTVSGGGDHGGGLHSRWSGHKLCPEGNPLGEHVSILFEQLAKRSTILMPLDGVEGPVQVIDWWPRSG